MVDAVSVKHELCCRTTMFETTYALGLDFVSDTKQLCQQSATTLYESEQI